jgi:Pregnancy-associated plasma protein-A
MKRFMPVAVLLVLLAAAAVATSTAAAKPRAIKTSWLCNPFSTSLTPTSRLLSAGARGDVAREPGLSDTAQEVPGYAHNFAAVSATVDVYVHSVTAGSTGAVSDADIAKQIQVLNNGFSGQEGGYPTGFTFVLAGVDRTDNADWFNAGPNTSAERDMKKALHQGDASDLNIYLTTAGVYLGWAYFPSTYKTKPWIDGIVIDWESMVRTSKRYQGAYDLGKTVTHETGHWLGLYHVFQGGCNNWGDYVDDTPPQLIATFGCPEGQDSCSEPGLDSIHNYVDYSYDSCYDQFTAGQTARMQDQWNFFRANGGSTVQ